MAQENIKITLPVSQMECEIKPYVTHKVSRKINSALVGNTIFNVDDLKNNKGDVNVNVELTGDKALEYNEILVEGMTVRIGECTKQNGLLTQDILDDLAEEDYSAIADKANEIYGKSQDKTDPKE